jgi:hypothetical protein
MSHETKTDACTQTPRNFDVIETALPNGHLAHRLNRQEAARYLTDAGLPIAATTLAKKAVDGSEPPFRIGNGRALYDAVDLLAWAEEQLGPKLRSTAERRTMRRVKRS